MSSRAAINRRGRAVVLKRTRILDKYSETFMMAGALPGKEKQTQKTINHGLKNTFKKTRSNFFLFRSPAEQRTRGKTSYVSLSLSAAAETFQPDSHPKKKKMERTRGFSIFGNRQQTEQTGPSQSSMAQSLTCLQIDPALHCYV